MSKTILANVDGFTPVIDSIISETSLMSAVVFGRIWRFCQMEDGVCNASLETIADGIGIDKATVMRHAKVLVEAGYLKDLTPDLRNHPHSYADTGKAGMNIEIGVAQRNATVAECNAGVAESKLKIDSKKDSKIQKNGAKLDFSKAGLEWAVLAGEDIPQEGIAAATRERLILDEYERAMGYNPLPWDGSKLRKLRAFLVQQTPEDIRTFAAWSKKAYSSFKPDKARSYPDQVIDNWPQAFIPEPIHTRRSNKDDSFYEKLRRA